MIHWIISIWVRRYCIAADFERPGHAICVTSGEQAVGAAVWKTADHGQNWVKKFNGVIDASGDPAQFWGCHIKYIPGHAGELLYTCGRDYPTSFLKNSLDDGQTWQSVRAAEIRDVWFFDFGPTLPGFSYPLVYFFGQVNGVRGVYVSYDWFATTPVLMTRFIGGLVDEPQAIGGDKNIPFRCYVTGGGGGGWRLDKLDIAHAT